VPEQVSTKVSQFVIDADQRVVQALRTVQADGDDDEHDEQDKTAGKALAPTHLVDPTPEQLALLTPPQHLDGDDTAAKRAHDQKFAHAGKKKHLHQAPKIKTHHQIQQPGNSHQ
jgi:hypothetical protein